MGNVGRDGEVRPSQNIKKKSRGWGDGGESNNARPGPATCSTSSQLGAVTVLSLCFPVSNTEKVIPTSRPLEFNVRISRAEPAMGPPQQALSHNASSYHQMPLPRIKGKREVFLTFGISSGCYIFLCLEILEVHTFARSKRVSGISGHEKGVMGRDRNRPEAWNSAAGALRKAGWALLPSSGQVSHLAPSMHAPRAPGGGSVGKKQEPTYSNVTIVKRGRCHCEHQNCIRGRWWLQYWAT